MSNHRKAKSIAVVDFTILNGGSVFILTPCSAAAMNWVDEHISDDAQYFGNGIAIEHRYVGDILDGILNEGFVVQQS